MHTSSLSRHAVLLLAVLLPLVFAPAAFIGFDSLKFGILWLGTLAALLGILIGKLQAPEVRLPINPIALSAVAVVVFTLISAFASPVMMVSVLGQGYALDSVLTVVSLFALFTISGYVFASRADVMRLHSVMMAVFLVLTLIETLRLLALGFGVSLPALGFFTDPWVNTVGKWNDLAILLGLGVVMTMTVNYVLSVRKAVSTVLLIASSLALLILMVINFRIMWIVLGITAIGVFGYAMTYGARNGRKIAPIFPIVVALLSCLMIIDNFNPERAVVSNFINQTLTITYGEVRPDWAGTTLVIKDSLMQDPLFGAGPSRFAQEWHAAKPEGVNLTQFWNVDFQYGVAFIPTTLVTLGIFGFLAWLVFVGSILFYSARGVLRSIDDPVVRYATVSTGVAVIYLWAFVILYVPGIVILAITFIMTGSFIGMLLQQGIISSRIISFKDDQRHNFVYVFALVFAMMLAIVFAYMCAKKVIAEIYFERASTTLSTTGDTEATLNHIGNALFFSANDTYFNAVAEVRMLELAKIAQDQNLDPETRNQQIQQYINAAIESSSAAIAFDPTNFRNFVQLASIYQAVIPAEGSYQMAVAIYDEAAKLAPQNPGIRFDQAISAALAQDFASAGQYAQMALQIKPNFVEAAQLLAQLQQAQQGVQPDALITETDATEVPIATSTASSTEVMEDVEGSGVESTN